MKKKWKNKKKNMWGMKKKNKINEKKKEKDMQGMEKKMQNKYIWKKTIVFFPQNIIN